MGEYYFPMNGVQTPYHRTQLPLPAAPSTYRPPLTYLGDAAGKYQNCRPNSSSSWESDLKSQDERELLNGHPTAYPFEFGYHNTTCSFRPYASTASSENEAHPFHEAPDRRPSTVENRSGSSGVQELTLPPINNQLTPDSRYSADEPPTRQEEYAEDLTKANIDKAGLSESEHSPKSKSATGKKPSSLKVSEKRRQQNRAAQRAMRERRKFDELTHPPFYQPGCLIMESGTSARKFAGNVATFEYRQSSSAFRFYKRPHVYTL
ncbi:hypothetical protein PTTG_03201 [Puccinia triticina 1-1 BBBD Race 1]|uniref:BZIP domain-containing protein n=2 Tax=Puccinia triticina TaxID=208348 RepID=A0A0C4EQZ0_PUCT1|nr:hypothetical protein PTTG_03201 [Puccinia triticina 1-1 BBBD Race 1]